LGQFAPAGAVGDGPGSPSRTIIAAAAPPPTTARAQRVSRSLP